MLNFLKRLVENTMFKRQNKSNWIPLVTFGMSERRIQGWLEIKEGLQLDACGHDEEAFGKYLEGVQKLCSYIKEETTFLELQDNNATRVNILKILSTMKESLTRVENIISKPVNKDRLVTKQDAMPCANTSQPPANHSVNNGMQNHRSLPIERAQKENIYLWKSYQNRWKSIKDPAQRVTLSLELQRRIQENLAVAREKASKYRQEQAKKEAEALHLAARKLASSCVNSETVGDAQSWSNKVALCACVLRYRPEDNWTQSFTKQYRENQSQALVTAALRRIIKTTNHPLTTWLLGKRENMKETLSRILSQQLTYESNLARFCSERVNSNGTDLLSMFDPVRNLDPHMLDPVSMLKGMSEESSHVMETFLQIFAVSLDLSDYSDHVDACYPVLEHAYFGELWPSIIKLYRHIYKNEEAMLSAVCKKYKSGTDTDVNISDLLSLPAQKLDVIFVDLQNFLSECSPFAKVHSLVDITHILCENDSSLKYEKILSADDLIGLVSCLLVQSSMPHLYAEFEALEQFIPHRFLLGEEGYSLTTFLTAIRYLESQGESLKQNSAASC